jgi:hypothetical protein
MAPGSGSPVFPTSGLAWRRQAGPAIIAALRVSAPNAQRPAPAVCGMRVTSSPISPASNLGLHVILNRGIPACAPAGAWLEERAARRLATAPLTKSPRNADASLTTSHARSATLTPYQVKRRLQPMPIFVPATRAPWLAMPERRCGNPGGAGQTGRAVLSAGLGVRAGEHGSRGAHGFLRHIAAGLAVSLPLVLIGCATPVMQHSLDIPDRFAASPDEPEAAWWDSFGDPVLSDLVRRAARENRHIRTTGPVICSMNL